MEHLAEELDTLEASKVCALSFPRTSSADTLITLLMQLLAKFSEAELAAMSKASHAAQTKGTSSAESLPFLLRTYTFRWFSSRNG
jgi:hypothetical protein